MVRTSSALLQHGCVVFSDVDAFEEAGRSFLDEGERCGERTLYFDREETVAAYGDGALQPKEQVEVFRGILRESLAEGYTGLRVVADLTGIVPDDPEAIAELARYEHLVDRFMATTRNIYGRCGYDASAIDPDVLAALSALHAADEPNPSPVHLTAVGQGDLLRLAGDVDSLVSEGSLPLLVNAVLPDDGGNTIRIDAADLAYIDHRSLVQIDEVLAESGIQLEIVTNRHLIHRLVDFVGTRYISCIDAA